MGVTAFIPAKMTSRRLPGKNMLVLCGHPVLYYSIRAAQLADGVSEIVVSSEDPAVLAYAAEQGATPHMRDPGLSRPETSTAEVLRDWYNNCARRAEIVALLQPTHPLRDPDDLSRSIRIMYDNPDADCIFTVCAFRDFIGTVSDGIFTSDFVPFPNRPTPERFKVTGSLYIFRPERTFLTEYPFGQCIRAFEQSRPELEVDIDYPHDFAYAEAILKSNPDILARYER